MRTRLEYVSGHSFPRCVLSTAVITDLHDSEVNKKVLFALGWIHDPQHLVLILLDTPEAFNGLRRLCCCITQIDQTFIGAILTAIGYSINDKVVIFDRVREFFGLYPKRDKRQLFNDSLNTTLARTINTSLSTLIVLLCIFILGGDSIRSFAFAMILGVVFGTLSSLFVASPIAYLLMKNKKGTEPAVEVAK